MPSTWLASNNSSSAARQSRQAATHPGSIRQIDLISHSQPLTGSHSPPL
jgi:hypothetical protein